MIYNWEASRLVCTPKMKAVITQMQSSLLPNSSLYKWLWKQEETPAESQGEPDSEDNDRKERTAEEEDSTAQI